MSAARRIADALNAGALTVGLVGAALWLWRPQIDVAPVRPQLPPLPALVAARAVAPADVGLAERVVATNPFDTSRSAPSVRWTPPDGELVTTGAAPLPGFAAPEPDVGFDPSPSLSALPEPAMAPRTGAPPASSPVRARDRRVPALFGTVVSAEGARALLRLDARIPGAQLYAEGARAGGWRVQRVETDHVVLVGSGGTVTLRMPHASAPRRTDVP